MHLQHVSAADGVQLALHRLGPRDGTPVLLTPGTFSNATFWLGTRGTGFARELAGRGFETWVLEFRGHGASQRSATNGARWNFDDWGRLDVPAALRAILAEGRRPLVVGHSAGGASLLAALAAEPGMEAQCRAAVIVATPLPWLQYWRRAAAHVLRLGSRHLKAFPARLLRLGPDDELPGVMEQWMEWNLRGEWVGRDGTHYAERMPALRLPLLCLAGSGDHRFAPVHACRGLYDLIGSPDRLFIEAGTGTGFSRDYGHVDLLVSREARAEVWPLLADWLTAHSMA